MSEIDALTTNQVENCERLSWADLPHELLCEVYSRVYGTDRAVIRCVCRPWKLACPSTTIQRIEIPLTSDSVRHDSPYLLFQGHKLYHPMVRDVGHHISVDSKPGARIRVAKDGWFLMIYYSFELFFHNPITRDVVQLPHLYDKAWRSMCFSKPPTSRGWEVFVAQSSRHDYIEVYSIRDGKEVWSFDQCKMKSHFELSKCNAVMHKGSCYFLCRDGKLIEYSRWRGTFKFHARTFICQEVRDYGGQQYLLESDGKLLGVFVSCDGHFVRVYQWDSSIKKWKTIESLDNTMLFVSSASSISQRASVKGTSNKIYFPRLVGDRCLFYSMSTKRYHTFEGDSYEDFNIKGLKFFQEFHLDQSSI